jgi:hypothetical protein
MYRPHGTAHTTPSRNWDKGGELVEDFTDLPALADLPAYADLNEQFACYTSVKIRSKLDLKRKKGEFIGAFAPYGYEKRPDNSDVLVVDSKAAQVVRDIFAWYARDDMSLGAIVRRLNSAGVPNPTMYKNKKGQKLRNPAGNDGLWSASSVRRILANEVYLGKMVQGREEIADYRLHKSRKVPRENWYVVSGTHEPIVDFVTFQAARKRLAKNVRSGVRGNVYPLGGLLKCGECGKAMSRKSSKSRAYYCCRTTREKGRQFCQPHSIREDILFGAVLEAINGHISLTGAQELARSLKAARKNSGQSANPLSERLCKAKKELENEIAVFDKTYYDYAGGNVSGEQFRRIRELCEKRQQALRTVVGNLALKLESESPGPPEAAVAPDDLESLVVHGRARELTRGLALALLKAVYVYGDSSVRVCFKSARHTPTLFVSADGVSVVTEGARAVP